MAETIIDVSSSSALSSGCLCIDSFEVLPLVSNPCSLTSLTARMLAVAFIKRVRSKLSTANAPLPCSQIRRALTTWKIKDFARAIWMRGPSRTVLVTTFVFSVINRCKISKSSQAVSSINAKPTATDVSPFEACNGKIGVVIRGQSPTIRSGSRLNRLHSVLSETEGERSTQGWDRSRREAQVSPGLS